MSTNNIPFNKPFIVGKELSHIAEAVIKYGHLAGDGHFGKRCQAWLEQALACRKALITHSCTAALEIAAILCDIQTGDEIIMPSYTFVSTANAFVLRGGVPVFIDIRPDTLNLDEKLIEPAITDRTKAIAVVHYAGYPCAMNEVMAIAEKFGLLVIEDAAQSLYSRYRGQFLGTIGHLGALSFHETKNIISGEGGALLINDSRFIKRAEIIWEKGTNRKQFYRGEVDRYTWTDIGSSFLPSELVSAFLYAQIEKAEQIITRRSHLCDLYDVLLQPLARNGCVRLPVKNDKDMANGHMFFIITRSFKERSGLITFLQRNNIHAVFHYVPLHSSPAGKRYGRSHGELVMTNDLSDRIVRLPLFYEMDDSQVRTVVEQIEAFYAEYGS